eukprot:1497311-Amphidinium_carterae.1
MEFPRDVVPVTKRPETSDTTSDQKPSTVSFGAVSYSSQKQEESTPIGDEVNIKHASEIKEGRGCYLCGEGEGSSRCYLCKNIACCQHLRVKIDQKTKQAMPICRSCSLTDETSRKVGLESLPVKVHHLVEGVKALSNLCAGTKEQSSGSVKSYQQVLSERLGISTNEDPAPEEVLARLSFESGISRDGGNNVFDVQHVEEPISEDAELGLATAVADELQPVTSDEQWQLGVAAHFRQFSNASIPLALPWETGIMADVLSVSELVDMPVAIRRPHPS